MDTTEETKIEGAEETTTPAAPETEETTPAAE